jgi:hypothetical protein
MSVAQPVPDQGDAPSAFANEVNYGARSLTASTLSGTSEKVEGTRHHRMLLTGIYQLAFGKTRRHE